MSEIALYHPPTPDEYRYLEAQAARIAKSEIIPKAYRNKPADIMVATLRGRAFGWDMAISLANIHVVEGVCAIRPEAMLGLVYAKGHSVSGEVTREKARVTGKRVDSGNEMTVEFTIEDAVDAGLVAMKDGKPYARARSNVNTALPWEAYTSDMLWARAVGRLCRRLFPDVILGIMAEGDVDDDWDAGNTATVTVLDRAATGEEAISDKAAEQIRNTTLANLKLGDAEAEIMARVTGGDERTSIEQLWTSEVARFRLVTTELAKERAMAKADEEVVEATVVEDTKPKPAPRKAAPSAQPERDVMLTDAQKRGIFAGLKDSVGITDRDEGHAFMAVVVGRPVTSTNELTKREATKVLETITGIRNGALEIEYDPESSAIVGIIETPF